MVYPVDDVYVTADFGIPGSWAAGRHTGTDFRAAIGTPVRATKGGVVVFAGYGGLGAAYGLHVVLQVRTRVGTTRRVLYAHLSREVVSWGERVDAGEIIGYSGNTGNSTGPHLHYEERAYPYGYYNYRSPIFLKYRKPVQKPVVYLNDFRLGKKSVSARRVKRRLNHKFPHGERLPLNRTWGKDAKDKYARWQKRLGYEGKNANGVPGRTSLEKLGFRVKRNR